MKRVKIGDVFSFGNDRGGPRASVHLIVGEVDEGSGELPNVLVMRGTDISGTIYTWDLGVWKRAGWKQL